MSDGLQGSGRVIVYDHEGWRQATFALQKLVARLEEEIERLKRVCCLLLFLRSGFGLITLIEACNTAGIAWLTQCSRRVMMATALCPRQLHANPSRCHVSYADCSPLSDRAMSLSGIFPKLFCPLRACRTTRCDHEDDAGLPDLVQHTEDELLRALDHVRSLHGTSRVQVDICRQVLFSAGVCKLHQSDLTDLAMNMTPWG